MEKKNQKIINEIAALQTREEELAFIAEFDSFKDLCRLLDVSYKNAHRRFNEAQWSLMDSLFGKPGNTQGKSAPVRYHGVLYPSITAACKAAGTTLSAFNTRRERGWSEEEALNGVRNEKMIKQNTKPKPCFDPYGVFFRSMRAMCDYHNIDHHTTLRRLAHGNSLSEALGLKNIGEEEKIHVAMTAIIENYTAYLKDVPADLSPCYLYQIDHTCAGKTYLVMESIDFLKHTYVTEVDGEVITSSPFTSKSDLENSLFSTLTLLTEPEALTSWLDFCCQTKAHREVVKTEKRASRAKEKLYAMANRFGTPLQTIDFSIPESIPVTQGRLSSELKYEVRVNIASPSIFTRLLDLEGKAIYESHWLLMDDFENLLRSMDLYDMEDVKRTRKMMVDQRLRMQRARLKRLRPVLQELNAACKIKQSLRRPTAASLLVTKGQLPDGCTQYVVTLEFPSADETSLVIRYWKPGARKCSVSEAYEWDNAEETDSLINAVRASASLAWVQTKIDVLSQEKENLLWPHST